MDRQQVEATTYQMRNFYVQLRDGYFSTLDTFNYQQHLWAARWCRRRDHVLDLCCGRGLVLPLLRYWRKDIRSYTGVDLEPRNAVFAQGKRVTDGKPVPVESQADYYPFPVAFVEGNVAQADQLDGLAGRAYDRIIYTASIEHMHPDAGEASLLAARKLVAPRGAMLLSCPNTKPDQDGYDTRYRAHVYEWKRDELVAALERSGWVVRQEWGLLLSKGELRDGLAARGLGAVYERLAQFVPTEFLIPALAPLVTEGARELAFVCEPA